MSIIEGLGKHVMSQQMQKKRIRVMMQGGNIDINQRAQNIYFSD